MKRLIVLMLTLAVCAVTLQAQQKAAVKTTMPKDKLPQKIGEAAQRRVDMASRVVKVKIYMQDMAKFSEKADAVIIGFKDNYKKAVLMVKDLNEIMYDFEPEPGPYETPAVVYRAQIVGGAMTLNKDGRVTFVGGDKIVLPVQLNEKQKQAAAKLGMLSDQQAAGLLRSI